MNNDKYSKTAIFLHWIIGFGILAMFALGWFMTDLPKDGPKVTSFDLFNLGLFNWNTPEEVSPRTFYYNLHKSIGITLLVLVIFRTFWRITHQPPALLETLKIWEKKLATAGHHMLYLLMYIMPVTGLVMAVFSKFGIKWFGIPLLSGLDNKSVREAFMSIHEIVGWVLLAVITIHVLGALKHKFIDKDKTLSRMSFH